MTIASHVVRFRTDGSTRYVDACDVVDDDQQREAGQPRRVRLPLEPVQRLGEPLGRDPELLDPVEAAAVDLPRLAGDAALRVARVVRRLEVVVERDEVERRADPGDAGDDVQPAEDQVGPLPPVVAQRERHDWRHRSIAIWTSSSTPVSSSSSRVRSSALAEDRDDLAPRPAVDEDDEAEAEPLLVGAVQLGQLGEHLGIVVGALLGRRARRQALARTDRRVRVEHRLLLVRPRGSGRRRVPGRADRRASRAARRARVPFEQLRELLGASAAAVGRARVGRDEERDVVVAVVERRAPARRGGRTATAGGRRAGRRRRAPPRARGCGRPRRSRLRRRARRPR